MALLRATLPVFTRSSRLLCARYFSDHDTSGAIRQAGGSFSKKEKAQEDQYFRELEAAQLRKLKEEKAEHHEDAIDHHRDAIRELEEQIRKHKEKIRKHKRKLDDIDDEDSD